MITRKPFVMCNPVGHNGRWLFYLEADKSLHEFVENLPCVQVVLGVNGDGCHVYIDMRYDYEEAWLWIYEQLEAETSAVQLDDVWGIDSE